MEDFNMKRAIEFLKQPLLFPILILGAIYIFWLLTAPTDFDNYSAGLIMFGIYILITLLAQAASTNWKFTVGFIILALPLISLLALFIIWALSETQLFGWYKSKIVFILEILLATTYPVIILLSKRMNKNRKTSLVLFFTLLPILAASILYPILFYPVILDEAQLGNYKYYISSTIDWDNHSFQTFYKCKKWSFGCEYLTSSYSAVGWEIIVDEEKKEVTLLGFPGLTFTDGDHPRSYTGAGGQLGDHIYYLSDECNNFNNEKGYYDCESYTYTLYECDLNNKSCNSLPVQYTHNDNRNYLWLEPDETTNEINIYEEDFETDDVVLIFTYGEHPRCYVEGCEILEETK
jgi:hypothetical protein